MHDDKLLMLALLAVVCLAVLVHAVLSDPERPWRRRE